MITVRAAAILALMTTTAAAEESFLRTLAETRNFMLGRPVRPRPTPDGKAVLFLRSPPRSPEQALYEYDLQSGKTRELVTPAALLGGAAEQLAPAERARRERMRIQSRGFTTFDLSDDGRLILLALSGRLYTVERPGGQVTPLRTGESPVLDPRFSPDGKRLALVRDRDLYVYDLATHTQTRLTRSPDPLVENGLAEFVAQEEMGRHRGYWWSPDSTRLLFEEADSRTVETFHLGDVARPEAPALSFPYPRPGKANAKVRLGLVPATGGEVIWASWEEHRLPYLAQVAWSPGAPPSLVVMSRGQQELQLLALDEASGRTRLLVEERDPAWINLEQTTPRWLGDGSAFLWSSEREGSPRLELRDRQGQLLRILGPEAGYHDLVHVDDGRRLAYFHGGPEPSESHLGRLHLDRGTVEWLTREPGQHSAAFGRGHDLFTLTSTTLAEAPRTTVHSLDGAGKVSIRGELPSLAETPPFAPRTEIVRLGESQFRASLTRPRNFDSQVKYPVILEVYGGPHHLQVSRALGPHLMRQWLADRGYVVVAVDGRGTPRRGRAWERAIRGNFAEVTLADQVAGLEAALARYPELDRTRIGVYGWSFGGYLAALAVLRRPDLFRVAVAGAPVVDWLDYDTCYTERYLGLPDENRAGYRDSSLLTHAPRLARPLLLIHGTADDNVYFFHTLKLADALFRAGKPFDVLPLAGFTHMVPDPLVKERLYTRIADYFAAGMK